MTKFDNTIVPETRRSYLEFSREKWSSFRAKGPMDISMSTIESLVSATQPVTVEEVMDILLPLSHLLSLRFAAKKSFPQVQADFLGIPELNPPYVIGISGSVAVGKSSFARILAAVLSRWPGRPKAHLVTTDAFLFPLAILKKRNLLRKKGFPESYNKELILNCLVSLCRENKAVHIPVYSHELYDIIPSKTQFIASPDVIILEGLNVLQRDSNSGLNVTDFIDFSIYIDAAAETIKKWYLDRFVCLKNTAFQSKNSYFNKFKSLSDEAALSIASDTWNEINLRNLIENILPTRDRASLIVNKIADHSIDKLMLRPI